MKKVFLSLLTLIYMTASSGMAMEIHFCMGERTGADFYISTGDTCGRCGMKEQKGGCCSDEQKFIKLSDGHKTSSIQYESPVACNLPLQTEQFYITRTVSYLPAAFSSQTFEDSGPPLYISHCVFRI